MFLSTPDSLVRRKVKVRDRAFLALLYVSCRSVDHTVLRVRFVRNLGLLESIHEILINGSLTFGSQEWLNCAALGYKLSPYDSPLATGLSTKPVTLG